MPWLSSWVEQQSRAGAGQVRTLLDVHAFALARPWTYAWTRTLGTQELTPTVLE